MTGATAKQVTDELTVAMGAVAARYGLRVAVDRKSLRCNSQSCEFKVEVLVEGAQDQRRQEFDLYCGRFGLRSEHYGQEFQYQDKRWRLVGLNLQAAKYPIAAELVSTGTTYKLPLDAVRQLTGAVPAGQRVPLFASVPPPTPPGYSEAEWAEPIPFPWWDGGLPPGGTGRGLPGDSQP